MSKKKYFLSFSQYVAGHTTFMSTETDIHPFKWMRLYATDYPSNLLFYRELTTEDLEALTEIGEI